MSLREDLTLEFDVHEDLLDRTAIFRIDRDGEKGPHDYAVHMADFGVAR